MSTSRKSGEYLLSTAAYYESAFSQHGATPLGVDWSSAQGQAARFEALDGLWDPRRGGILCDFGCGYGAYATHLLTSDFRGGYVGVDLSMSMISYARANLVLPPGWQFTVGSAPVACDYVVASGTFNVITEGGRNSWRDYVWSMIHMMFCAARSSFAFNLLLEPTVPYADREDLFWARPDEVVNHLKDLNCDVQVIQGYGLHEATYIARKTPA